ncbi:hypothetical protein ACH5RR_037172 [Cinchona calisaya]|uniref:Uncharacterized protein n=1 Tax=Cinchona calisaya TaxID=153742 RepID=A0ABD2Y5F1_9GENT
MMQWERLPLTHVAWNDIPEDKLDPFWDDMQMKDKGLQRDQLSVYIRAWTDPNGVPKDDEASIVMILVASPENHQNKNLPQNLNSRDLDGFVLDEVVPQMRTVNRKELQEGDDGINKFQNIGILVTIGMTGVEQGSHLPCGREEMEFSLVFEEGSWFIPTLSKIDLSCLKGMSMIPIVVLGKLYIWRLEPYFEKSHGMLRSTQEDVLDISLTWATRTQKGVIIQFSMYGFIKAKQGRLGEISLDAPCYLWRMEVVRFTPKVVVAFFPSGYALDYLAIHYLLEHMVWKSRKRQELVPLVRIAWVGRLLFSYVAWLQDYHGRGSLVLLCHLVCN